MGPIKQLSAFWRHRSLKFWLAMGMLMTFLPSFLSALGGYLLYHQAVIQPLAEVASKHRQILLPLQQLQLSLWGLSDTVVDYEADGKISHLDDYHKQAAQIADSFKALRSALQGDILAGRDLATSERGWQLLEAQSSQLLSQQGLHGDHAASVSLEQWGADIDGLGQDLGQLFDDLRIENEQNHDQALADLQLLERLAIGGFSLSLLFACLGVWVINRSLVNSMEQLAQGAQRLAAGDREHQVHVRLPHELVNVAAAFNQMTQQILEQERALARAAATDGLTGLYNRREFDRLLAEELQRSQRYGKPFSLIICDIDHFKDFNDSHGHQAGDQALRTLAKTLQDNVREVDKACRLGGEEFVVILPEGDQEAVRQTAERLRKAVEEQEILLDGGVSARITISLGVASHPDQGNSAETLLWCADTALYQSKEQGRNKVTFATQAPAKIPQSN
ncbi:diguanylate cyclase [Gallaecimonas kandeliae]|uniref:diguanylate cyclase n=1 Tax=Gallaecimonas kandeliae TaxID=3029055 RepID=UPI002647257F|nr:diguanylate cyclase [Gallaecimonas kandeliae]WKE64803.1 diguanylate cyclase [Gallaecimonas kandeliae]